MLVQATRLIKLRGVDLLCTLFAICRTSIHTKGNHRSECWRTIMCFFMFFLVVGYHTEIEELTV